MIVAVKDWLIVLMSSSAVLPDCHSSPAHIMKVSCDQGNNMEGHAYVHHTQASMLVYLSAVLLDIAATMHRHMLHCVPMGDPVAILTWQVSSPTQGSFSLR